MSKKEKCKIFKKIQKWIVAKRLISGQWDFSCRYMLRSSPCMQNLLIVRFIVWQIWPKNQISSIFEHFLSIFWAFFGQKIRLKFDLWAEILHRDAPGAYQPVCKIWCDWLKAFGRGEAKRPKVSKNAKFCTLDFTILTCNFEAFLALKCLEMP